MRVGLQIEEMLLARLGIPNIFVAPVGNIVIPVVIVVASCVFAVQEFSNVSGIALRNRQKAFAGADAGDGETVSG